MQLAKSSYCNLIKFKFNTFDSHRAFLRMTVKSIYKSIYSILILNIPSFDSKLFKIVSFRFNPIM